MSAEIRKKAKSFKQKVLEDAVAGLHTNLLLLGENLGLFDVLVANVPMTSDELAVAANINKRYCQEWCLHMAATHVLSVDAASNKFQLQEGVAEALKDTATLSITNTMAAAIQNPERLQRAYQTGEGIGWGDHHKLLHIGTRRFFTPLYENALIPNLPNRVKEILEAGGSLLDVGCGEGVSSCVFGSAFPNATIHGVDFHVPSIEAATKLATSKNLTNVKFSVASSDKKLDEKYDVVTFFDCFHDMSVAVGAAKAAFTQLKPDGVVLLVEPLAADTDSIRDQLALPTVTAHSAFSCHICLPCSIQNNGDALGTCTPTCKHREIFVSAGFKSLEKVKNGFEAMGFRMLLANKL
eukprot:m.160812 g.160812  ORF g.160812 m.160812 type:complete len:352 (-) comp31201_c0_seq4:27-1082(-)